MADSKIEWTDATWNPTRGCSRVSAGCDNCYAMNQAHRFSNAGGPYDGLTTIRRGKVDWTGKVRLVPEMLERPLHWRKPRRIFVNSMSDLFHESLLNEEILRVFAVMAAAPYHTFQILTKRPERALTWFRDVDLFRLGEQMRALELPANGRSYPRTADVWPLPNVWLGVSVEDQKTADERIPLLLECPAAIRFVSAEPLLGPIRFADVPGFNKAGSAGRELLRNFWVIVGGESGPGARPFDLQWARGILEQCRTASVPCFVKQLGAITVDSDFCEKDGTPAIILGMKDRKGGDMNEWPEQLRVREFPRAEARRG